MTIHIYNVSCPNSLGGRQWIHLPQIRSVILAVAVLAQRLAASALEGEAGGVHEHQVEPCETLFLLQTHLVRKWPMTSLSAVQRNVRS